MKRTIEQKQAWELYRKWICGRGYCWTPGCGITDDVQAACLEAIAWATARERKNAQRRK